eukprot:CAMPEP_0203809326 /NCGR_PEP_ID=MMETSP0115-20131106/2212_1 /ASSEMBLY_ACC=CAM_ASM_000227 /TAXON_ID=33651 /ORGANISM="Bicosoecid sp, Strain ms1" /LENGTH=362 /DNA_ID=CAMNT_0050718051 /DNA_START=166 /DNA_END=1251 /DNA_ORIENTATION=-
MARNALMASSLSGEEREAVWPGLAAMTGSKLDTVARALRGNVRVIFRLSGLTDADMAVIAAIMRRDTCARELEIEQNPDITDVGVGHLADALRTPGAATALRLLSLANNHGITDVGIGHLADVLRTPGAATALQVLSLGSNPGITDVGIGHLADALRTPGAATALSLNLDNNPGITDVGVHHLADVLRTPDAAGALKRLSLSRNRGITDVGVGDIADALRTPGAASTLDSMSLWGNSGITDVGVGHLADMLRTPGAARTLTHLNVDNCPAITEAGAQALLDGAEEGTCYTLTKLGCNFACFASLLYRPERLGVATIPRLDAIMRRNAAASRALQAARARERVLLAHWAAERARRVRREAVVE